jgi:hypothetical protein
VVERPVELVDGVGPEGVANLRPIECDADGRLVPSVEDVPVIGEVAELVTVDRTP